ncbi:hypothetical protein A9Q98_06535 [Thalassotalea sp. 42_200_T64]|nr:hypothetical protein A9Q98_06535 [Thalassotalea sp. 42_200_T64]
MQAIDTALNEATTNVTVNITPLLTLSDDQIVPVGESSDVTVGLSGPAVTYPVTIDYTLGGDAVADA